jgi:hypothetical protein
MSTIPTITINMDADCRRCGKAGALRNGLCLPCISKAIGGRTLYRNQPTKNTMPKTKKNKVPKEPRLKPQDLPAMEGPGVARVTIKALEAAVEEWADAKEARERMAETEASALAQLTSEMSAQREKITTPDGKLIYVCEDGRKVTMAPGKMKVKLEEPVDNPTEMED